MLLELGYELVLIKDEWPSELNGEPVAAAIFSQHNRLLQQNWAGLAVRKLLIMAPMPLPSEHNRRIARRFEDMNARRGASLAPHRLLDANPEQVNLHLADHIFLYGNLDTLSTYPPELERKTYCSNVSASFLGANVKSAAEMRSAAKGFLWFGGGGVGYKGLDLCLEAFAARPDLMLYVVGDPCEGGFELEYRRELLETPNIRCAGGMPPSSDRFRQVINQCSFLLYPSASEGCSSAVATAMMAGLYPIVSRETGVDLPANAGCLLPDCGLPTIMSTIDRLMAMDDEHRFVETQRTQRYAFDHFSRESFSRKFKVLLHQVMHL